MKNARLHELTMEHEQLRKDSDEGYRLQMQREMFDTQNKMTLKERLIAQKQERLN